MITRLPKVNLQVVKCRMCQKDFKVSTTVVKYCFTCALRKKITAREAYIDAIVKNAEQAEYQESIRKHTLPELWETKIRENGTLPHEWISPETEKEEEMIIKPKKPTYYYSDDLDPLNLEPEEYEAMKEIRRRLGKL